MHNQIAPHGGELVNRILSGQQKEFWTERASGLTTIEVDSRVLSDIEMIANGAMSPLEGFMGRDDYNHVLDHMRLKSGLPWSLPIVLGVTPDQADNCDVGSHINLTNSKGESVAILHLQEKYIVNKEKEAAKIYKTNDLKHPGVKYLMQERADVLLSGDIDVIKGPEYDSERLTPLDTRHAFEQKGWTKIVAFQTRKPILKAQEYIQKCALEVCDGLLIHPLVGDTDEVALSVDVRMEGYKALTEAFFPEDRYMLSMFPASMRYAGPREAIFHAIIRKNYGCTHFIVGSNYASLGDYYSIYEAQEIFKDFGPHELLIEPLFFNHCFYCKKCDSIVSEKTCPHSSENHIIVSEEKILEMLKAGQTPPTEIMREEVAQALINKL